MIIDGYKLVCYGAQNGDLRYDYCKYCKLYEKQRYPPTQPCWRIRGIIKRTKCNIKEILKL